MPYSNVPKHLWSQMESCVKQVKKKGKVNNAYAVCFKSVVGSRVGDEARKRMKGGKHGN
jgi:hypothetical protein